VRQLPYDQLPSRDHTSTLRRRPVDPSRQTTTNFDPCRRCVIVRMRPHRTLNYRP
jgi:hypothetical protein